MKNEIKIGDSVKVGKTGKAARVMDIQGEVSQVEYKEGKRIAVVPTRWIRK